jgi:hypothetical protein
MLKIFDGNGRLPRRGYLVYRVESRDWYNLISVPPAPGIPRYLLGAGREYIESYAGEWVHWVC